MDSYVTAKTIKSLREQKKLTQSELAQKLKVSSKTVSKWETGKGLPDISILESLAEVLGVSLTELFTGDIIKNKNISANMIRSKIYVCPVCGNVITASGEANVSCHGITLPSLEAEGCDEEHIISTKNVEDEIYVTVNHEMSKKHFISFIAYINSDKIEITKLYPEGDCAVRFKRKGSGILLCYCNKHGLFKMKI